ASLRDLTSLRRDNLLRHWLRQCGAPMPSTRKLAAIVKDMLGAAVELQPCVQWGAWQVRRHGGLLYCLHDLPTPPSEVLTWLPPAALRLPAGAGVLRMVPAPAAQRGLDPRRLGAQLQVMFRRPHQPWPVPVDMTVARLKKLLQARGVLPWWRGHVPLLVCAGQVVAVGDLWVA